MALFINFSYTYCGWLRNPAPPILDGWTTLTNGINHMPRLVDLATIHVNSLRADPSRSQGRGCPLVDGLKTEDQQCQLDGLMTTLISVVYILRKGDYQRSNFSGGILFYFFFLIRTPLNFKYKNMLEAEISWLEQVWLRFIDSMDWLQATIGTRNRFSH